MPEDDANRETTDAGALRPAVRRRATPKPTVDEPDSAADAPEPEPAPAAETEPRPGPVADTERVPHPVVQLQPAPGPVAEPEPGTEPEPEPVKAPAKKAPAKKAPAKKAVKAAAKTAPAVKAAAKKAPAKKTPAKKAVKALPPVSGEPRAVARPGARTAAAPAAASAAAAAPAPQSAAPAPETAAASTVVPRQGTAWVRWLLTLSLLLVATAVGLGAAAAVEAGPRTFRASAVAELEGGSAPTVRVVDAIQAGQKRYAAQVPQLTETAARAAAVRPEDVRADLTAVPEGTARLIVTAKAADAESARRLARAGVDTLLSHVPLDQEAVVASEGDRLGASALGPPTKAVRTAPEHRRAAAVGVLAGGAVLLFALTAVVLRRGRM